MKFKEYHLKETTLEEGKQYLVKFRDGDYQVAVWHPTPFGEWEENNGSREPYDRNEIVAYCEIKED